MKLNGSALPWVNKILHLGVHISNDNNRTANDTLIKKATFISRFLALGQEFSFADPTSLMRISSIYNSSWFGSVLWPMDSEEFIKCESTYNRSIKKFFNLPWDTHRYLIEPLSESTHLRVTLGRRFLRFVENIKKCKKPLMGILLKECEQDTRTVTGSNLRYLMLESGSSKLPTSRKLIRYHVIEEEEKWRIDLIKMILHDQEEEEDRDEFLNTLCAK